MKVLNTDNSILLDDVTGNSNDNLRNNNNMMKSVSAISGLTSEKVETSNAEESLGKGVPINNFDSLLANMESLNIKFFN